MKTALITGITGQDGSYLAELLLDKGYNVVGLQRRTSTITTQRIDHLWAKGNFETYYGDLADANSLMRLLVKYAPDEIYNLGSMSHVKVSFEVPEYTAQVTGIAPLRILEALHTLGAKPKYYQASSSEMFGISPPPQNEQTLMLPVSPYGASKLFAYHITRAYRFGYGMFAANGILFNHESPRRGETFVTKKIVRGAVRIKLGKQDNLKLGNLEARRDWGHSRDYMRAVYTILQAPKPDDWVVATGEHYSVREFAEAVFKQLGMNCYDHIQISSDFKRPNEVPDLLGDPSKIKRELGWQPQVNFQQLVEMMVARCYDEEKNGVKVEA